MAFRITRTSGGHRAARTAVPACIAAALLGTLLSAGAARAQSGKGEYVGVWSVGASLGYAVPNTDEYGNAFAWRLAAGYSPLPQLEIDLEVGRFSVDVDQPDPGGIPRTTIASGTLEVKPVCVTAQYRLPLPEMLSTLTLLGGFGYYFVDYTMAAGPRAIYQAGGARGLPDQTVDDAWGLHLGAGLEYALSERVSLVAEGRYLFLAPEARGTATPGNRFDGTLDLNTWLFNGGVKVSF